VDHRETVIIGAGPTGLSAAYHIGADSLLVEQHERVGGWCRSISDRGFTFDYAGHIMFSNDPYVHQLYEMLVGDNVHWQDREAWIYSKNVYTRYPFQGALYGLPPDVIKECIVGAIEARFGSLRAHANGGNGAAHHASNGHTLSANGLQGASGAGAREVRDCCADGILEASARLGYPGNGTAKAPAPRNFEEFIYNVWGAGIAKHFAIPYNQKLWAVPLSEMETSWLGGRVPLPDLEEMIEGALSPVPKPMGPNARFGYVLRGGFQTLMDGFLPHLKGELRLNTKVAAVSPRRRRIEFADGRVASYRHLVSTMPLPVLVRLIGDEAPEEVRAAAARLRHVSVRCVNLGIGREQITDKHWIYYPEDTVFHRIFVQGNASPHCNPPGGFGLTCEITYSAHKLLPCDGDDLIARCIADCRKVGIIRDDDPIWAANQCDLPYAYVVYDHGRAQNVATIRAWLAEHDIVLAGRYSEWAYYNSDHAFLAGRSAAEQVRELRERDAARVPRMVRAERMVAAGQAM
jgi:UDP-galactopyranose mutase